MQPYMPWYISGHGTSATVLQAQRRRGRQHRNNSTTAPHSPTADQPTQCIKWQHNDLLHLRRLDICGCDHGKSNSLAQDLCRYST